MSIGTSVVSVVSMSACDRKRPKLHHFFFFGLLFHWITHLNDLVPPSLLGRQQAKVRPTQHRLRRVAGLQLRHAKARRDSLRPQRRVLRLGQLAANLLGPRRRIRDVAVGAQHGEFLAAVTRYEVARAAHGSSASLRPR